MSSSIVDDPDRFRDLLHDLEDPHADARFTLDEARDYLLSMHSRLLRAERGGEKLEAFRSAGPSVPSTFEQVQAELSFFGDDSLFAIASEALLLCPAAVRWHVLRSVAVLGVGKDSRAWTSALHLTSSSGSRLHRLIVLGPDVSTRTCLHEYGHAWSAGPVSDDDEPSFAVTARAEETFLAYLSGAGDKASFESYRDRSERLADALADCWLTT